MTVTTDFDHTAKRYPDRLAFTGFGGDIRYDEARRLSNRVANTLIAAGYEKETRFALLTPNCGMAMIAQLGALKAGAAWCNVNLRNSIEDNIDILSRAECRIIFYHSATAAIAREVQEGAPVIDLMVCLDGPDGENPGIRNWIEGSGEHEPDTSLKHDDLGLLGTTGGTTGLPKLTLGPHALLGLGAKAFAELMPVDPYPVNLVVAPVTHAGGILCQGMLVAGATNIMMQAPDLDEIVDYLQSGEVTTLFLPPTLVYVLLKHPRIRTGNYSGLRYLITMGAPMAPDKIAEATEVFGPVMCQALGQTEAGVPLTFITPQETSAAVADPKLRKRLGSCGRVTMAMDRIAIMDDDGNLLPQGESGEIVMQGPGIMRGYLNDPEATAEIQKFGWHHTGDIGFFDEDNFLYLSDRKRDLIISGGFNIFPFEVEQVLVAHPSVQECAVVGVTDEKWGEAVTGVIEMAPDAVFEPEEIIQYCKSRLGSMKAPKSVMTIDNLPRSPVGKVLKRIIRDQLNEKKDETI